MAKLKKRQPTDSEYFVELVDRHSDRRVAVGNFWGASSHAAIEQAQKKFPGLFAGMETHSWRTQAMEIPQSAQRRLPPEPAQPSAGPLFADATDE